MSKDTKKETSDWEIEDGESMSKSSVAQQK